MESNTRQNVLFAAVGLGLLLLLVRAFWGGEGDLAERLKNGTTEQRLAAVDELSRIGSTQALRTIAEYVRDPEDQVARRSLLSMGRRDWPEGLEAIGLALDDERELVREAALAAMARHDRKQVDVDLVVRLLSSDSGPNARAAAANVAGSLYLWDAMPALVKGLRDKHPRVRGHCAEAIRRIIGVDHGFRSSDPPGDREAIVRKIESAWPAYKPYHDDFIKRVEERSGAE